ncbi:MAG: OmpA family protein, partial [Bacteroidota bacterium]|nr:OmpA family protein [Candidatus Kapabacteria bacterium]MDW8219674.1 OmpA family protein [Bacteroidota bacterium]
NGVVFAATADGVYQSTNNGDTWTATPNRENIRSLIAVDGVLYAGAIGAVLRSTDNGVSWRASHEGLPNLNVWSLAVMGQSLFAGTTDGVYEVDEALAFGGRKQSASGERIITEPLLRATALNPSLIDATYEEPLSKITIEEFSSEKTHSLLNYIFFDENSAYLPLRYKQLSGTREAQEFVPEKLTNRETLDVYYDILNIIGYRLQQNTRATLTITGCNAQSGLETQIQDISMLRAQAVQQYLSAVWGISASRISLEARELPEKASRQGDPLGDQENRRVELYANWNIMKPVVVADTLREAFPAAIRLRPQILDTMGVMRWKLSVEQGGKVLRRWSGFGASSLPPYVDWYVSRRQTMLPSDTTSVECVLEVNYKFYAQPITSRVLTIPVERVTIKDKRSKKLNDVNKSRHNLILFDIGSDKVSPVNERIISAIRATAAFASTSTVRILGFTDAVGADDANLLLSQRRAEAVAQSLGITPNLVQQLVVKGRGETLPMLYDNDTPEGRFYCRAVVIEIDTPIVYE